MATFKPKSWAVPVEDLVTEYETWDKRISVHSEQSKRMTKSPEVHQVHVAKGVQFLLNREKNVRRVNHAYREGYQGCFGHL